MKLKKRNIVILSVILVLILFANFIKYSMSYSGENGFIRGVQALVSVPGGIILGSMLVLADLNHGDDVFMVEEKESPDKKYIARHSRISYGGALGGCYDCVSINNINIKFDSKNKDAKVFTLDRYSNMTLEWRDQKTLLIILEPYNKENIGIFKQQWNDVEILLKVKEELNENFEKKETIRKLMEAASAEQKTKAAYKVYWSDFSAEQKKEYLTGLGINKDAVEFYNGTYKMTLEKGGDNLRADKLLIELTKNDKYFVFYYFVYNQVLRRNSPYSPDSEAYLTTCLFTKHTDYVVNDITRDRLNFKGDIKEYDAYDKSKATLLQIDACEIANWYFSTKGQYRYYKDFKKYIDTKKSGYDREQQKTVDLLLKEIENMAISWGRRFGE